MYLTKIELDRSSSAVRAALFDAQKMHRFVTGFFQQSRKDAQILFRCRSSGLFTNLYLYSACPIEPKRILPGMRLVAQRDVSPWLEAMSVGEVFHFQLVTAPFRKVAEENGKNSRRRSLCTEEERLYWLNRKAEQGGFQILSVSETPAERFTAHHSVENGGALTVNPYCYTGTLRIVDVERFRRAVCCGIGAEKAYGLGMLMLKRP